VEIDDAEGEKDGERRGEIVSWAKGEQVWGEELCVS